jgi:hypothetical protein
VRECHLTVGAGVAGAVSGESPNSATKKSGAIVHEPVMTEPSLATTVPSGPITQVPHEPSASPGPPAQLASHSVGQGHPGEARVRWRSMGRTLEKSAAAAADPRLARNHTPRSLGVRQCHALRRRLVWIEIDLRGLPPTRTAPADLKHVVLLGRLRMWPASNTRNHGWGCGRPSRNRPASAGRNHSS